MKNFTIPFLAACIVLSACNDNKTTTAENTPVTTAPATPIALSAVPASPDFPGATLTMATPTVEKAAGDSAKITFNFTVKNYELKAQTTDNGTKGCNNSDKGQHIHFILDNQPYKALYEPKNEVTLANGGEHTVICFLSRSYHEALKNKEAFVIYHFKTDAKGKLEVLPAPKDPMLFYSRPKGDYSGKDTANVLLDFYLANCTLSDTGYYVNAHVTNADNGKDTTFKITKWAPNFIQNLGTGKCKAELSLMDAKQAGKALNTVTREFKLMAEPATK